jgi:hypothetical protein
MALGEIGSSEDFLRLLTFPSTERRAALDAVSGTFKVNTGSAAGESCLSTFRDTVGRDDSLGPVAFESIVRGVTVMLSPSASCGLACDCFVLPIVTSDDTRRSIAAFCDEIRSACFCFTKVSASVGSAIFASGSGPLAEVAARSSAFLAAASRSSQRN